MAQQITVMYLDVNGQGRADVYTNPTGDEFEATALDSGALIVKAAGESAIYAKDRWVTVTARDIPDEED